MKILREAILRPRKDPGKVKEDAHDQAREDEEEVE
jgi:hypothetical protein